MQQASWDNVIIPPNLKSTMCRHVGSFFKNKSTYDNIGITWKRGIILHGSWGNGKRISLKAMMKDLYYSLEVSPIPMLYVRHFQTGGGNENALHMIFGKARSVAPCMVIFDGFDSLAAASSYFLNQWRSLDDNNGIFIVRITEDMRSLDYRIHDSFCWRYEFDLPGNVEGGRPTYVEYWR